MERTSKWEEILNVENFLYPAGAPAVGSGLPAGKKEWGCVLTVWQHFAKDIYYNFPPPAAPPSDTVYWVNNRPSDPRLMLLLSWVLRLHFTCRIHDNSLREHALLLYIQTYSAKTAKGVGLGDV